MNCCKNCRTSIPKHKRNIYCNQMCQKEYEQKIRLDVWLETGIGHVSSDRGHYIRRYLSEQQGNVCNICGRDATWNGKHLTMILDHIDGNSDNNSRNNLRLICPNCDSQLDTYKSRNIGKGRHSRMERYRAGKSY